MFVELAAHRSRGIPRSSGRSWVKHSRTLVYYTAGISMPLSVSVSLRFFLGISHSILVVRHVASCAGRDTVLVVLYSMVLCPFLSAFTFPLCRERDRDSCYRCVVPPTPSLYEEAMITSRSEYVSQ